MCALRRDAYPFGRIVGNSSKLSFLGHLGILGIAGSCLSKPKANCLATKRQLFSPQLSENGGVTPKNTYTICLFSSPPQCARQVFQYAKGRCWSRKSSKAWATYQLSRKRPRFFASQMTCYHAKICALPAVRWSRWFSWRGLWGRMVARKSLGLLQQSHGGGGAAFQMLHGLTGTRQREQQ